jgi:hypothetical protein
MVSKRPHTCGHPLGRLDPVVAAVIGLLVGIGGGLISLIWS